MTRRSGLGRGLDALLPARGGSEIETREGLRHVPRDEIEPNPHQPREAFDSEALTELADSIRELGILQPLLVRERTDGRYELIAGERRLRAAKLAGLEAVPVMVVETDDRGSLERALVENIHRSDLNPIEEAAAYKQLIDDAGITQEELGKRLGRNRVSVTNSLRLLDLPTEIQKMLIERKLTAAHGRSLLGLEGNAFQMRVAQRVAQEKLSVRECEQLVRRFQEMSGTPDPTTGEARARPAEVTEAQRRLADHLQTRVRVEVGKRKGKIVLDFVSLDELDRLMQLILGDDPSGVTHVTLD